jgi:hypothetical protein
LLIVATLLVVTGCGQKAQGSPAGDSPIPGISNHTLNAYSIRVNLVSKPAGADSEVAIAAARRAYPRLLVRATVYGGLVDGGHRVFTSGWLLSVDPVSAGLADTLDWCLVAVDPRTNQVVITSGGNSIPG